MAATHPVEVDLDTEIHARMHELAKVQNRSTHYLMREAITEYLDREERREAFREEALATWAVYASTGKHLTDGEAGAWLAQLEAGHDVEPPACHD